MSRILITGHDGFTGQFLWTYLAKLGNEPVPFMLADKPIDLRDAASVREAIQVLRPQKIIHLAAISSVDHGDAKQIYDVNLLGTRNLLEAARWISGSLDAVVIASSANVYGHQAGQLSEAAPLDPANDYAVSKASVEMLSNLYKSALPIVIVRPFNYTGRGQSSRFVVAKIIEHLKSGKSDIQLGNLEVARDFSDVRDVCHFYGELISRPDAVGEVYNLCSGIAVELQDILASACRLAGRDLAITQDPTLMRHNDIRTLYGDPSKINKLVGEYRRFSLTETLEWMLGD